MRILPVNYNQNSKSNNINFKAINSAYLNTFDIKRVFGNDIKLYSLKDACMEGMEAYKTRTSSPCLGEYLSPVQLAVLQKSKLFKKTYITGAEAEALKANHSKDMFERLTQVMEGSKSLTLSDCFRYFSRILKVSLDKSPTESTKALKDIEQSLFTPLDETDYFMLRATQKFEGKPKIF